MAYKNLQEFINILEKEGELLRITTYVNPNLEIVSQASDMKTKTKILYAGAHKVITTTELAGVKLAQLAINPQGVSFLDILSIGEEAFRIEEIAVSLNSPVSNKTLGEINLSRLTGITVIAIRRKITKDVYTCIIKDKWIFSIIDRIEIIMKKLIVIKSNKELTKQLRKIGMTQKEFVELMGYTTHAVKKWKNNNVPLWVSYVVEYLRIIKEFEQKSQELHISSCQKAKGAQL